MCTPWESLWQTWNHTKNEINMSETVSLTIDGQTIEVPKGATILDAALKVGIQIPILCHNDELRPYGSCRMCVVELINEKRTHLVASCIYEVADGLRVETASDKVRNVRQLVIELLLARNPTSPTLLKIARDNRIAYSRFQTDIQACILCGLCVRVCREVVGVSAIGFKGRGFSREVSTPFAGDPPDCIACGACAWVCPTDCIKVEAKKLETFRLLRGKDRFCRYSLMGVTESAICANSFRCWKCEVEQKFLDQLETHPIFLGRERDRKEIEDFNRVLNKIRE